MRDVMAVLLVVVGGLLLTGCVSGSRGIDLTHRNTIALGWMSGGEVGAQSFVATGSTVGIVACFLEPLDPEEETEVLIHITGARPTPVTPPYNLGLGLTPDFDDIRWTSRLQRVREEKQLIAMFTNAASKRGETLFLVIDSFSEGTRGAVRPHFSYAGDEFLEGEWVIAAPREREPADLTRFNDTAWTHTHGDIADDADLAMAILMGP